MWQLITGRPKTDIMYDADFGEDAVNLFFACQLLESIQQNPFSAPKHLCSFLEKEILSSSPLTNWNISRGIWALRPVTVRCRFLRRVGLFFAERQFEGRRCTQRLTWQSAPVPHIAWQSCIKRDWGLKPTTERWTPFFGSAWAGRSTSLPWWQPTPSRRPTEACPVST